MIDLAVLALGRRPTWPAIRLIEDEVVLLALEFRLRGLVRFERVEVLQKQQPRALLRVIELAGAARVLPEHSVDVLKNLFKHTHPSLL